MTPFDFVNAITYNKEDLFEDPQAAKDYVPFIVNRALSYFPDTVFYANEMNRYAHAPKEWQFQFLRLSINKRRRFSKWVKKAEVSSDLDAVKKFYKYSTERALEAMSILSQEQIEIIKLQMSKGGKV